MNQHSSVNINHGAGNVGGELRREKQIDIGHIRCCAEPAQRNALDISLFMAGVSLSP